MREFLKCDEIGCDHVENVAEITEGMIGKRCPKCGANLLTEGDWEYHDTFMRPAMEAMEACFLPPPQTAGVRNETHPNPRGLQGLSGRPADVRCYAAVSQDGHNPFQRQA